ncbi:MAG: hypothetical protein IJU64_07110 [Bacilli bacterium]|nr:hypothetical protein [Bacilli bacterium]
MVKLTHDAGHLAAINLTIEVEPGEGFNAPNGTYYVHISLKDESIGRLNVTASAATENIYDDYVASDVSIYVPFTVADATFSKQTKFAVLSLTGARGDSDKNADLPQGDWEFTVDSAAGTDAAAVGSKVLRNS